MAWDLNSNKHFFLDSDAVVMLYSPPVMLDTNALIIITSCWTRVCDVFQGRRWRHCATAAKDQASAHRADVSAAHRAASADLWPDPGRESLHTALSHDAGQPATITVTSAVRFIAVAFNSFGIVYLKLLISCVCFFRLYLSGVFFFIMMYTGSNVLPLARFLKYTHLRQAFR